MSDAIQDPRLRSLAAELPIMLRNGQPRKFRLYCECYEWAFTQMQRRARQINSRYVDASSLIEAVDRTARALWHHQNPRAPA